jgi:hypothetical protein
MQFDYLSSFSLFISLKTVLDCLDLLTFAFLLIATAVRLDHRHSIYLLHLPLLCLLLPQLRKKTHLLKVFEASIFDRLLKHRYF